MTVVNPKSISGINSITTGSGSDDILTIHTNNGTERLRVDSTGTTKIVTGIVTTLTATTGIVTTLTANTVTSLGAVSGTTGTFSGNVAVSGANITLQDSGSDSDDRLLLGASSDLQLYHDGTNSIIHNKTGQTWVQGSELYLSSNHADGQEKYLKGVANGAVELYYNDSLRFATTSAGVSVSSSVDLPDNGKLLCGDSDDLQIDHSGTNSQIYHNGTGSLYIATLGSSEDIFLQSTSGKITLSTGGSERLRVIDDGITFNGDTAAANALDDYEEGTWTPYLNFSGTNNAATMDIQQGMYRKIGTMIFAAYAIRSTNFNSSTGAVRVAGLPYTSTNTPVANISNSGVFPITGVSFTGEFISQQLSGSVIELYGVSKNSSGNVYSSISVNEMNQTGQMFLKGSIFYNTP